MNESLETFQRWFWVSLMMLIFYCWLLFLKTRRPQTWLRYNTAEATAWSRFGLPRGLAGIARQFGASKASTICLRVIVVLFALLMLLNAGAYVYFKNRIPPKPHPLMLKLPSASPSKPSR